MAAFVKDVKQSASKEPESDHDDGSPRRHKSNKHAALSDSRILKCLRKKKVIIEPFDEKNLHDSCYDLRLGGQIMRRKPVSCVSVDTSLTDLWLPAILAKVATADDIKGYESTLKVGDSFFLLQPNETVIIVSLEAIGSKNHIAVLSGRHSTELRGITVKSGFSNIGFYNRWNLVITNANATPCILKPGDTIASIRFLTVSESSVDYSDYGSFQTSDKMDTLLSAPWQLPKDTKSNTKTVAAEIITAMSVPHTGLRSIRS
jgi:deoxycytidine triphosphate deaminase